MGADVWHSRSLHCDGVRLPVRRVDTERVSQPGRGGAARLQPCKCTRTERALMAAARVMRWL